MKTLCLICTLQLPSLLQRSGQINGSRQCAHLEQHSANVARPGARRTRYDDHSGQDQPRLAGIWRQQPEWRSSGVNRGAYCAFWWVHDRKDRILWLRTCIIWRCWFSFFFPHEGNVGKTKPLLVFNNVSPHKWTNAVSSIIPPYRSVCHEDDEASSRVQVLQLADVPSDWPGCHWWEWLPLV